MELLLLLPELLGNAVTAAEAALLLSFEQPERPIIPDVRFCVTTLSDENCRQQFRFDVAGVIRLTELFALPEFVITGSRDKAHATEAVCILLHRLSYPKRHYDMIHRFGRSTSALCRIFMHVGTFLRRGAPAMVLKGDLKVLNSWPRVVLVV